MAYASFFQSLWIYVLSFGFLVALTPVQPLSAQAPIETQPVHIEVFARDDCVHCQDLKQYLDTLATQRQDFVVTYYDIKQAENTLLWEQFTTAEKIPKATPVLLIGSTIIQGFASADTTGKRIEAILDQSQEQPSYTFAQYLAAGGSAKLIQTDASCEDECIDEGLWVPIPFWGAVDLSSYSLPAISGILGLVDGFNPCAMWVLVTFLIVLVKVGDRRKMVTYAGLFILAEAIMYFLILTVWFNAWDFIGLDQVVTPIVGVVAIGGGLFFLYEWYSSKNQDDACKVTSFEQKRRTHEKLTAIARQPLTWLSALAIIGLAFSVNVIEFACSIGIPQAFTKILEIQNLEFIQSLPYLFLYIVGYMVDDFIVFGLALWSFEKIGLTSKYTRWSNLIGGVLMLILGSLLIFKPQWLLML